MNIKKTANLLNNNPVETRLPRLDNRIHKSPMTLYTCTKCRLSFVDRNSDYECCPFCGNKTLNKE